MTKADPQEGIVTFSKEDLLCEEDKGKTFDPESAFGEPDLKAFIQASSKKERLEGTELFLADSRKAIVFTEFSIGDRSVRDEIELGR